MPTYVDWGRLVGQNRAKAVGVPWTPEEQAAINSGVSPDDVRAGIVKKEEVPASNEPRTLERMNKPELIERAQELEIVFDEAAVNRADLIEAIKLKLAEQAASQ